jgi:hypothetical protein
VIRRLALILAMAAPLGAAIAQSPHTVSLRIDNDAFDFWMMPWNRPDEEYTSGVHITYDGGRAPWWSGSFLGRAPACTMRVRECRTARAELGQDIYTPAVSADDPRAAAGSRANAGWLYLSQTARALRDRRSDELTLTLGVTGPPSLARFTQRLAHSAAPEFNRPTDWTRQIAFEPGAIVRYEQRRRVAAGEVASIGVDVIPNVALSAGNVNTSAEFGLQSRVGWHLRHPWLPEEGRASVALTAGVSGRAVARDIFLDGNTFRGNLSVGHEPFVGTGELGLELRYRAISLAYRAVTATRAYDGGPKWHPWSSMVAGVTFQ